MSEPTDWEQRRARVLKSKLGCGIIGCGKVGRRIAAYLLIMGVRVDVWDGAVLNMKTVVGAEVEAILSTLPRPSSSVSCEAVLSGLFTHLRITEVPKSGHEIFIVAAVNDPLTMARIAQHACVHGKRGSAVLMCVPGKSAAFVSQLAEWLPEIDRDKVMSVSFREDFMENRNAPPFGIGPIYIMRSRYVFDETVAKAASFFQMVGSVATVVSPLGDVQQCAPAVSVAAFLASLGLTKYTKKFEKEEVTPQILRLLTDADLKSFGLPTGPRRLFLSEAAKLPAPQSLADATASSVAQSPILEDVVPDREIGSGVGGTVYVGLWGGFTKVAMKSVTGEVAEQVRKEAQMLGRLRHPNVAAFYGIAEHTGTKYLVMELADGSVRQLVMYSNPPLSSETLLQMAVSCCAGMSYLARANIVHRDLAARNLLYFREADGIQVKVADFGLATSVFDGRKATLLPQKWTAIDVLITRTHFSSQSDVWSFGVVLWELFSRGRDPYSDIPSSELITFLLSGKRLARPDSCPNEVYSLMLRCWNDTPTLRPTFDAICTELMELLPNKSAIGATHDGTTEKATYYGNLPFDLPSPQQPE